MILVGAKADLEYERKVPRKQAEALAERYGIAFVETSAKEDSNIKRVFEMLTTRVLARQSGEQANEKPDHVTTLNQK